MKLAAVIGFFVLVVAAVLIPPLVVQLLWNWAAPIYFTGLPEVWKHLQYWHVFGLMLLFGWLRGMVFVRGGKK